MTTAKLVSPHMDKGWSLQFFDCDEKVRNSVIGTVMDANTRVGCRAFLQGDFEGWMMVEFWTDDEDRILQAAEYFARATGVPIS